MQQHKKVVFQESQKKKKEEASARRRNEGKKSKMITVQDFKLKHGSKLSKSIDGQSNGQTCQSFATVKQTSSGSGQGDIHFSTNRSKFLPAIFRSTNAKNESQY